MKKAGGVAPVTSDMGKGKESVSGSRKPRKFNLHTYKIHALGGYVKAIRLFGTADGYSTQTVCIRLLSGFYF